MEIKFYEEANDCLLKFAVIIAKTNGKWVLCKHKDRSILEVAGGHREPGEDINDTDAVSFTRKRVLWSLTYALCAFTR